MNQEKLSNSSFEKIKKRKASLETITWILALALIGSLSFFIFVSIKDGVTPLLAVPLALSAILPVNFKNIKILAKEIESRKRKVS